jgi:hypothetical protein
MILGRPMLRHAALTGGNATPLRQTLPAATRPASGHRPVLQSLRTPLQLSLDLQPRLR